MDSIDDLRAKLQAVAAENFGRTIGELVRAVDVWEETSGPGGRAEMGPPSWAIEARDAAVRRMEFLAEGH